jgi:hypothetical protein
VNPFDALKLAVGGFLGGLLVYGWATFLYGPSQVEAGKELERSAARARAMELIEKRAKDNDELSNADARTLCLELGGVWVSDAVGCR